MPRPLRIHVPGGFYHVTLRGNHQQKIFVVENDRHLLNTIVTRALERSGSRLHAYCWMSNHLHLLMQVADQPLARPMRQIACEFARAMQAKLETTGHFFERRFHANLVDTDAYLLELVRYIHMNPVEAGIVTDASHFEWSSHHCYLGSRVDPWVVTDFVLAALSGDPTRARAVYRTFMECPAAEGWTPGSPANATNVPIPGNDQFVGQVIRAAIRPKSRQTLPELISEACQRFEVDRERLDSKSRDAYLTKVRAWIAYQASERGIATRSEVARVLGRTEGTLRYAILAYPEEMK